MTKKETMNLNDYLKKLVEKNDLEESEAEELVDLITSPDSDPVLISAILTALRTKGESVEEIAGFIKGMRKKMVSVKGEEGTIDIVGTGGDGSNSFNISTATSFVVAGTGVKVAKHGNRAASSKCGSADVLEVLGVNINLDCEKAQKVLEKTGMVFMFAPLFHPAMKTVVPIRKILKIRTIFNFLGPFLNPAGVKRMLLGVPNLGFAKTLAKVAKKLDFEYLLIVTSEDGMDEITVSGKTHAIEIRGEKAREFEINPEDYGIKTSKKEDLVGGDPKENAEIIKRILNGEESSKTDAVLLNSAFALIVAGKVETMEEGLVLVKESIKSGKAFKVLENLIKETNSMSS